VKSGKVQINDLRVKAHGLTPEQARRLGQAVAKRLADVDLNDTRSRRIPTANVRLQGRANRLSDAMVNEIVMASTQPRQVGMKAAAQQSKARPAISDRGGLACANKSTHGPWEYHRATP
jgi:hypothetical protein